MAIARQSLTQGTTVTAASQTQSVVISTGSSLLLLVLIHLEGAGDSVSSATWNGVALTKLGHAAATNWARAELWYLKNPTPATANLVVNYSGSGFHKNLAAAVFTGVDQTTTFRAAQTTAANSGTSSSLTVPSVVSGDYVLDALTIDSAGHAAVPGADQTEEYDLGMIGSDRVHSSQPGASSGVMSYSWTTSAPFAYIATALIADGGGATLTKSLADTITLSDAVVKNMRLNRSDSISLLDTVAKTMHIIRADNISLSDAIIKTIGLTKADTLVLSESVVKALGITESDTITLSDSANPVLTSGGGVAHALSFADTIALSDAVAKHMGLSREDQLTLADDLARALNGRFIGGDVVAVRAVILEQFGIY